MTGLLCNALAGFYKLYQLKQQSQMVNKKEGEGAVESKRMEKYDNPSEKYAVWKWLMIYLLGNGTLLPCNFSRIFAILLCQLRLSDSGILMTALLGWLVLRLRCWVSTRCGRRRHERLRCRLTGRTMGYNHGEDFILGHVQFEPILSDWKSLDYNCKLDTPNRILARDLNCTTTCYHLLQSAYAFHNGLLA